MVEAVVPSHRPVDAQVRTGLLMAATASTLFAINGSVSKVILLSGISAMRLTELRSAGAFLVLGLVLLLRAPERLRVTWREVPELALYGIVGFAFVQWFYFVAIQRLPVSVGLLLEYTAPLLVALWARFGIREPVRRRVWAALVLSLVGLGMVAEVWGGSDLDGIGVAAGFLAAGSLAFYFVYGEKKVRSDRDPVSLVCWAFGFATLFWSLLLPWWTFPWSLLGSDVSLLGSLADVTAPLWLVCVYMVLLGTVAPFVLIIGSLQHLRATQAGMVGMLEPVVAAVVAWWWLGEALGVNQLLGGAVVLTGVALAQTAR